MFEGGSNQNTLHTFVLFSLVSQFFNNNKAMILWYFRFILVMLKYRRP